MNYKTEFMRFRKTFLESDKIIEKNRNKPLAVLKYTAIESLYNMYSILMNPSNQEPNTPAAKEIGDIVKKIVDSNSQSEIIDILDTSNKDTFNRVNTDIFINDYRYVLDDIYITNDDNNDNVFYDFPSFKNDIITTKKRINIFKYDIKDRYRPVHTNIKYSMNQDSKEHYETYMFLNSHFAVSDIFYSDDTIESYKKNETDHLMCGDRINFKFDTDFDIAFYNACFNNISTPYSPEKFRNDFYFVNGRVKSNSIIMIGLHRSYATYSNLEFLSMYLENINVYKHPASKYFLITGTATKRRQKNIKELYSIIEQICFVDFNFVSEMANKYHLDSPDRETDIIFKSTYLDKNYALSKINANSAFIDTVSKNIFSELSKDGIKEDTRQPLIPFNPGQLGLVLVSGDINGAIDEGNGHYHVIRGAVKRVPTRTFHELGEIFTTTKTVDTITTTVEVMLADGTCLRLG